MVDFERSRPQIPNKPGQKKSALGPNYRRTTSASYTAIPKVTDTGPTLNISQFGQGYAKPSSFGPIPSQPKATPKLESALGPVKGKFSEGYKVAGKVTPEGLEKVASTKFNPQQFGNVKNVRLPKSRFEGMLAQHLKNATGAP